ncbi:calcium-binding protein [Thalassovita taeanensis]|nr:hypothetical protein [Thalassovita taeanensis]
MGLFDWIWSLENPETGQVRAWAASSATGEVHALTLDENQTPQTQSTLWIGTTEAPYPFADMVTLHHAGQDWTLMSSGTTGAVSLARETGSGRLQMEWRLEDPQGHPLTLSQMVVIPTSGTPLLLATPASAAAKLRLYRLDAGLQVATLQDVEKDTPKAILAGVSDLIRLSIGTQEFVVSSSSSEDGLSSFVVTETDLELRDTLGPKDGLWINGLEDITALSVGGQWFIAGVSAASNTLSAIRLNPMGAMFVTDIALDDQTTRFAGAMALDSFEAAGRSFIVTGGTDAGLSLFELLPGGQLYHHQSLAQSADWDIGHILSLTAVVIGDELQVLMAGADGSGVAQLVLPLGNLGDLVQGSGQSDTLSGAGQDDLLMGLWGDDQIAGNAGDDTLIAGPGQDTLTGGAGADVFVFTADGQTDRITDFQPGLDRVNLDDWGMVYDISALTLTSTSWGGRIIWRNERIDLYLENGARVDIDMWEPDDFLF